MVVHHSPSVVQLLDYDQWTTTDYDGLQWTTMDYQTTMDYDRLLDYDGLQWTKMDYDGLIVDTHSSVWSER